MFLLLILSSLTMGGFLKLDKRVYTAQENYPYYPMYNDLRLEFNTSGEKLVGRVSLDWRFYNFPEIQNSFDISQIGKIFPYNISIYEAYFQVSDFLISGLDLKVGKQRISWGTADGINPTDNLNPPDLSDPMNFSEHIPTETVKLDYYIGSFDISGIYIPAFHPALLPQDTMMLGQLPFGGIEMPDNTLKNSSFAGKIKGNILNFDVSASYLYGWNGFPYVPSYVFFQYAFEREQMLGCDFSGEIASVGIWGEGGYFIPQVCSLTTVNSVNEPVIIDSIFKPYYKGVIGFDYTFPWNIYLNIQGIHGMPFERKEFNITKNTYKDVGNYIFGRMEKNLSDVTKFTIAGGVEIKKDSLGYIFSPKVEYHPVYNLKLEAGYFYTGGDAGTLFGRMKAFKQIFIGGKLSF